MHIGHALVGMLSPFPPIGTWVLLGMLWIQSMHIEPLRTNKYHSKLGFSSDQMKSYSSRMKASLQQQQQGLLSLIHLLYHTSQSSNMVMCSSSMFEAGLCITDFPQQILLYSIYNDVKQ